MHVDDRPTIAAPDDDPYLWLEDVEGARALDFVEQQNRRTLEQFGGARFVADRDILAAIYDRPDNIPYVGRRGKLLYNLWKDTNNPRGLWRRTTIEQFRKEIGKYVDQAQVAEYEKFVFVPIDPNQSDAATLQQIPGLDANEAQELIAGRPYGSGDAFLDKVKGKVSAEEFEIARSYLAR